MSRSPAPASTGPAGDGFAGMSIALSPPVGRPRSTRARCSRCADVSVEVDRRRQVAVVGPSGSGKTTMLTVMGTLERPTRGRVRVAGHDVATRLGRRAGRAARSRGRVRVPGVPPPGGAQRAGQRRARDAVHRRGRCSSGARSPGAALERVGLGHRLMHQPAAAVRWRAPAGRDRARDRQAPA